MTVGLVGLGNIGSVLAGTLAAVRHDVVAHDLAGSALHAESVAAHGTPATIGSVTGELWRRFAEVCPGVDFTLIYPFVEHGDG